MGHGTRQEAGQAEFLETVRLVAQQAALPVEGCYLELAEPNISQGLGRLAERGVRRVVVVPLLLFAAGHAKLDVPAAVFAAAKQLDLEIAGQAEPLEFHPLLLELSRQRVKQQLGEIIPAGTVLLLVGRGNSDPLAINAVREYTQLLAESLGLRGETAFMAAAQHNLAEKLAELAQRAPACVVILPHLLFAGEVLTSIQHQVAAMAGIHGATRWLLCEHLGPEPRIATAILDRAAVV